MALLLPMALIPIIAGCAGSSAGPGLGARSDAYDRRWGVSSSARVIHAGPVPKGGGTYKLGRPYQVGGRWYVPRHEPSYDRVGTGSWYGADFHGRRTANGEIYDMAALTAAHPTLPMPSYAYVTNLRNGRTILVRINDRGPYVADRVIDLSRASATALGYSKAGLGEVRVRWAGHAPLDGNVRREQAFLRMQPWFQDGQTAVARYEAMPTPYDDAMRRNDVDGWGAGRGERLPWLQQSPDDASGRAQDRITASGHRRVETDAWQGDDARWPQRDGRQTYASESPRHDALVEAPAAETWSPFGHRESLRSRRR